MSQRASAERIQPLADDAWLIELGDAIGDGSNARVHALAAAIRTAAPRWLRDLVPAYCSLGVFFEVELVTAIEVRAWLLRQWAWLPDRFTTHDAARIVEIPVLYGDEAGPDLASAAAELGLDPETLAQRHAAALYTVAMIGFAPGFPYLSGIYPRESPGGWRLLGRTPARLFDPLRDPPALLAPGDRVRFRAIDADAFARLAPGT